jgi:hypothetical protein
MGTPAERRREERLSISSINLPFLGSREEDQACFQYIIMDISKSGLKFAIPRWLVNRESLKKGDRINFHLPLNIGKNFYNQGVIVWTAWDDSIDGETCGAILENTTQSPYPVFISLEEASISVSFDDFTFKYNLFCGVMKDTALLKQGVAIYLGHLIPFFSRISMYPQEEYPKLKESFLTDVRDRAIENHAKLESLSRTIKDQMKSYSEIPKFVDLEGLRAMIESEIYVEIFRIAFQSESIMPYLNAIKELEKRLYFNYNTIVMLYVHAL